MVSSHATVQLRSARDAVFALWLLGWALFIAPACGPGQYYYDANGRLVAVIDPTQDNAGGGTAIYNYDGAGNLTSIKRQATTALAILSFTPSCASAGGGSTITVNGTGFSTTAANNVVTFPGGATAAATSATATQLIVPVPAGAPTGGSATLTVRVSGGTPSPASAQTLTVGCGAPTISDFTTCPSQTCATNRSCCFGVPGTAVTITGTNFDRTAANDRLTFYHNRLAGVGTPTATQIMTTAPVSITSGKLMLTTPQGLAVSPLDFFAATVAQVDPNQAVTLRMLNPTVTGVTQTISMPAPDPTTGNRRVGLVLFDAAEGDTPCWSVDASALMPTGSGYLNLPLYDPDGNGVIVNGGIGAGYTTIVSTYGRPLSTTGTYTLVTQPNPDTTGSLTVTAYDPHVTFQNIVPTLTGTPATVTTTGPCQQTWFRFTEAQAGHRFSATGTSPSPSDFSYRMDLLDAQGAGLGGAGNCLISGSLSAGSYQLKFTGNDPTRSAGSVTLTLYDVTDEVHQIPIDPSTHTGSIHLLINAPNERAQVEFTSLANTSSVTVQMDNPTNTNGWFEWPWNYDLYDPGTGNTVANGGPNRTIGPVAVTANHTYRVRLQFADCAVGSADITITNN